MLLIVHKKIYIQPIDISYVVDNYDEDIIPEEITKYSDITNNKFIELNDSKSIQLVLNDKNIIKLNDYILKHKEKIDLKNINSPQMNFNTPLEIFEQIYNHEREITRSIDSIAIKSDEECDFATRNFIDWYLKEQIEEEDQVLKIISKLKAFGSEKSSLYLMDNELGQREYHMSVYQ